MFTKEVYEARRQQLKKTVGSGIILLPGNGESSMNYKDNWYHFRQDSTFLYYTGIDRADLFLVIDIDNNTETLFGNELTIDDIVWTGPKISIGEQAAQTGIGEVLPLAKLAAAVKGRSAIHFLAPYRPDIAILISEMTGFPVASLKEKASVTLIRAIAAQRSIKSAEEVAEINKAVDITADMHLAAMRNARAGVTEAYVAGFVHAQAISAGGNLSFPTILTVNGEVLHNHYGNTILKDGQMVLCDAGGETHNHYAGDMTRTFPVGAKFSAKQKEAYNIVLDAQQSAIKALKPGILFKDVHLLACERLTIGLQQLGLMKGDVKEAVAAGAHTLFFQCGLGHMMGMDVHDMENLGEEYIGYTDDLKKSKEFGLKSLRLGRALETGFVVTIEPGLYFIPELIDRWGAEKKHAQFINYDKAAEYKTFGGIRIEDDYLITATGSQLLGSDKLPRIAEEVEKVREESI
ncbi:MAG: aminopeptidase P family protein [Chitinophagaceae bacterium]